MRFIFNFLLFGSANCNVNVLHVLIKIPDIKILLSVVNRNLSKQLGTMAIDMLPSQ